MTQDEMRAAAIDLQSRLFKTGDPFDGDQHDAMSMTRHVLALIDLCAKLQRFKDYVHKRLDDAGVSVDPESPHKAEGCRIGGRLDELIGERDRLRTEVARSQSAMQQMVSGFRSHLGDLIRRIGPARRPEDIKAELEEVHASYNVWADRSAEAERDRLLAGLKAFDVGGLLEDLDAIARDKDHYEYGLPMHDEAAFGEMRVAVPGYLARVAKPTTTEVS